MNLQNWVLHVLQKTIDKVDSRVDQLIPLVLGLGSCRVDQFVSSNYQSEISGIALSSSPKATMNKGQDLLLSCF